ncbi:DUF1360 domain-containing protein [Rossellomorea vietnamensis]|uniref:DUF1360 domain-containing protein n=1 Tax=Rossellomorea vietnamensis TaxID=218284 RepID=A0A6I6UMV9_9BACI|nr:DUF1360 domain-containing protein [Rossellomorea vietnamensis]QHE61019.1 DUF1360 domain-containing protein [Rossellomorea vietnamensis]
MQLTFIELFALGLAIFRLTHLLVFDKITEFLRAPFFDEYVEVEENGEEAIYLSPKKGGLKGFIGELLSCYWCTGIWVSGFLYGGYCFFPLYFIPLITILAVAGIAAILEAAVQSWKTD